MKVEGVWTAEAYGAFGWENRGIFVLENGRTIGGDNRMYCSGTYDVSGDQIEADWVVYYFGPPRTVFGEADEEFTTVITGKRQGSEIIGTISRADRPQFDLQVRLTKRLELPNQPET